MSVAFGLALQLSVIIWWFLEQPKHCSQDLVPSVEKNVSSGTHFMHMIGVSGVLTALNLLLEKSFPLGHTDHFRQCAVAPLV